MLPEPRHLRAPRSTPAVARVRARLLDHRGAQVRARRSSARAGRRRWRASPCRRRRPARAGRRVSANTRRKNASSRAEPPLPGDHPVVVARPARRRNPARPCRPPASRATPVRAVPLTRPARTILSCRGKGGCNEQPRLGGARPRRPPSTTCGSCAREPPPASLACAVVKSNAYGHGAAADRLPAPVRGMVRRQLAGGGARAALASASPGPIILLGHVPLAGAGGGGGGGPAPHRLQPGDHRSARALPAGCPSRARAREGGHGDLAAGRASRRTSRSSCGSCSGAATCPWRGSPRTTPTSRTP